MLSALITASIYVLPIKGHQKRDYAAGQSFLLMPAHAKFSYFLFISIQVHFHTTSTIKNTHIRSKWCTFDCRVVFFFQNFEKTKSLKILKIGHIHTVRCNSDMKNEVLEVMPLYKDYK